MKYALYICYGTLESLDIIAKFKHPVITRAAATFSYLVSLGNATSVVDLLTFANRTYHLVRTHLCGSNIQFYLVTNRLVTSAVSDL